MNERYRILKTLSHRKDRAVHLVYDEISGAERIVKELKGTGNSKNDFTVLRKLRYPGIPEIYDAFETESSLFVVMEFIEGHSLHETMDSGPHEKFQVIGYILDVLDSLVFMHSVKPDAVIHGDIKPENIIIRENRAVLIDFGSAAGDSGSSGFCAPERLAGFASTIQADIYSVGQVLHFCFTGRTRKLFEKCSREISGNISNIIEKAVMKRPAERYKSAMEMANDLRRLMDLKSAVDGTESGARLISIPANPHFACELAYVMSSVSRVLLVDADVLSPGIDMLMGLKKFSGSSEDYGFAEDIETGHGIVRPGRKNRPDILPCRGSYDLYEDMQGNMINGIAGMYAYDYDAIVVSTSGFPYDSIFMESLLLCEKVVFSVEKGPYDIRRLNNLILHISRRQGINKGRFAFVGYGFLEKTMESRIAEIASEAIWLGNLPQNKTRISSCMDGLAYLPSERSSDYKFIKRAAKKLGVM